MSQTIDVRIYMEPAAHLASSLLGPIVDAVTAWGRTEGEWQAFKLESGPFGDTVDRVAGPVTASALKDLARRHEEGHERAFLTCVAFRCWQFESQRAVPGFVNLGVETWDSDSLRAVHGAHWIEGDARLVISRARPYWAILDESKHSNAKEWNRHVEENVDSLLQLMSEVAKALSPSSIKVFLDSGDRLPFNSHATFYRAHRDVVSDLRNIAGVWMHGLPTYKIPPLGVYVPQRHDWVFSELRTSSVRQELWQALSETIEVWEDVSEETVREVLASPLTDVYKLDEGFVVLNYPYCLNGFVDDFFVDLLRNARRD